MLKSNSRGRQTEFRFRTQYRPKDLGDLEILEDDAKLKLLKRVRAGDLNAIDRMIMSHIRMVLGIVNRHLHNCPHYAYDLDSIVMLGVVNCVHKIADGAMAGHDNVTGYIVQYTHGLIQREIGKSYVVPTPRSATNIVTKSLDLTYHTSDMAKLNDDGPTFIDLRDSLEHLARNRREQRILELRGKGYTDHEVGEILGVSQWTVRRIRLELYHRFRQQQKEENE